MVAKPELTTESQDSCKYNIIAQNAQDITIIHKKQGRDIASPAFIEFVINEDVEKLAEKMLLPKNSWNEGTKNPMEQ